MENKTAEEFLENEWNKNKNNCPFNEIYIGEKIAINNAMIEFAKYHVQKSLEEASTVAEGVAHQYIEVAEDEEYNKEAVLNAYPLENIK